MNEIKTTTPSGNEVTINYDGKYKLNVKDINLEAENIYVLTRPVPQFKNEKYPVIDIAGKSIVIIKADEKRIRIWIAEIDKMKKEKKDNELNTHIPGCTELQTAYDYRYNQIEISRRYMDRVMATSIGSGDKGNPEGAEKKVRELEQKYSTAKKYIKWVNADPSSNYGFAAHQAAKALYNGATIEDAEKIANNYNVD